MIRLALLILSLVVLDGLFCAHAEEPKQVVGSKELRNQCRAFFYYTAALAEEDKKPRMALLTKAIETDPRQDRAYYNRGVLYVNDEDLPRARADFKKAAELNDKYINAHYNLACVHSLESHPDEALASLEAALASGYQKFDKIPKDSDLKNIRDKPSFARLIAKYKSQADTTKLSVVQRFQIGSFDQRGELLTEAIRSPDKQSEDLARWAMHEPDYQLRVLSMSLWRKIDVPQSKRALVCGLHDTNGYVCKAAANQLVKYGKGIEDLMVWSLEDTETGASFYAVQVLAAIDARQSANSIAKLLGSDDHRVRIVAAQCLARLGAVATLPQVENALKNLPKDEGQKEAYETALRSAIAELMKAKEKGEK
jgi:tetratricopeptide (TPR) repeat protein